MIKNNTKGKILCRESRYLKSILSKAIGLMFSRKIHDTGLVFFMHSPVLIDLHMFFVFFPIDVIFLGDDRKVIELKENFLPFSFYVSKKPAKYFIELPHGAIKKSGTEIGDVIDF